MKICEQSTEKAAQCETSSIPCDMKRNLETKTSERHKAHGWEANVNQQALPRHFHIQMLFKNPKRHCVVQKNK